MTTFTINLSDEQAKKLEEQARLSGMKLNDHVRLILESHAEISANEVIGPADERFKRAKEIVFKKNAELYRRLA